MSSGGLSALARLGLGATAGALFGVLVLFGDFRSPAPESGVVASVNGSPLDLAQYRRALRLYASEKRSAVTLDDRALILERMIEEELLRQHGVANGLVRSDPQVRARVLSSVMTSLTTQIDARQPAEPAAGAGSAGALEEYLGQLRSGATIRWAAPVVDQ
jgi:hypothetical protein